MIYIWINRNDFNDYYKKKRESKTSQRIFLDFVIICFKKFKEPISFFFFLVFFFYGEKRWLEIERRQWREPPRKNDSRVSLNATRGGRGQSFEAGHKNGHTVPKRGWRGEKQAVEKGVKATGRNHAVPTNVPTTLPSFPFIENVPRFSILFDRTSSSTNHVMILFLRSILYYF